MENFEPKNTENLDKFFEAPVRRSKFNVATAEKKTMHGYIYVRRVWAYACELGYARVRMLCVHRCNVCGCVRYVHA